jgi:urea carboxylase
VGTAVKTGEKLILLESMKMIIPIQAPHDGIVTAVHCQVGEAVQPGIQLIALESEA